LEGARGTKYFLPVIREQPLRVELLENKQAGTFRGSLRAPIHRWFSFPVGFSPALVQEVVDAANLPDGANFYDPFAGTATSLIVARQSGLEAHGLEAHPFIHFVGRTKLRWDVEPCLGAAAERLLQGARAAADQASSIDLESLPALLIKCYEPDQLRRLIALREYIRASNIKDLVLRDLAELALAAIARPAANVSTKWPNVAPKRPRPRAAPDPVVLFSHHIRTMLLDLASVAYRSDWPVAQLEQADARLPHPYFPEASVDLVVTSPPYLNNFDYADRTRLETYLLGHYSSWADLTKNVRRHLVISATPQFNGLRTTSEELLQSVWETDTKLGEEIACLIQKIVNARRAVDGEKRFDLVAAGYFRDMVQVLTKCRPVLRTGARMHMVLGDSALFGVHVPTDELMGRLGLASGFRAFRIETLRSRGNKWPGVRRSVHIPLRESLVTLEA
jgi:DNA modification methylase